MCPSPSKNLKENLMRKSLAVVALTAALTGGTTALATQAYAAPAQAAPSIAQEDITTNTDDGDKTGLWGLLGLLGLAGLIKKKEHAEHTGNSTNR